MISFICGQVADITENSVIIETGGIGYEIFMTGEAIEQAARMEGKVKIHTYFQVREDTMVLYGFFNKDDLQVFKLLLGVNGVGPKAALGVLAGITADELRFAVLSDDVKTLSKAPGIGKKTAQKLILELKDKLNIEDMLEHAAHGGDSEDLASGTDTASNTMQEEAVQALTALGYGSAESLRAVKKSSPECSSVEDILKEALKFLL